MRSLQSVLKAILILLTVLVLDTPASVSALGITSGFLSGSSTLKTLSLEDDFAVLASSPDPETATKSLNASAALSPTSSAPVPATSDNIAIRAVNPGYTETAGKNSGELIELVNLSDESLVLDDITLVYTAKPTSTYPDGKTTILYQFPEGARFVGASILLRFVDAPEVSDGAQDLTYDTSLAMSGSLALKIGDEILSSVCWLGGEDCLLGFSTTVKSRLKTTILRDDITGVYAHTNDYTPLFDLENSGLYLPPASSGSDGSDSSGTSSSLSGSSSGASASSGGSSTSSKPSSSSKSLASDFDTSASPICQSLEFSELLTYYVDDASEQFIEFYNTSDQPMQISGCKLRYKNKFYDLAAGASSYDSSGNLTSATSTSSSAAIVPAYGYLLYRPELKLTKNPTTDNLYELFDVNGDLVDTLNLPHGQKSGTSYAQTGKNADGSEIWQLTYSPTPGAPNSYQEFRTCPVGKVINEATGNCVNAATLSSTLKDCGEGKYRNPETGRCKSYDNDSEQTPCKEGYERNPETGRCRKITENSGADYPLVPITDTEENSTFIAIWAIVGIAGLGAAYVIFQFRREILYFFRKHLQKLKK